MWPVRWRRPTARGRAAAYFAVQVFEPAWYLRGLENMLMDFLTDEEMAAACMDKMCRIQCEIARRAPAAGWTWWCSATTWAASGR